MYSISNDDILRLAIVAIIIITVILFMAGFKHWWLFAIIGIGIILFIWYWSHGSCINIFDLSSKQNTVRVEHYRCRNNGKQNKPQRWNTTKGDEIGKLTRIQR